MNPSKSVSSTQPERLLVKPRKTKTGNSYITNSRSILLRNRIYEESFKYGELPADDVTLLLLDEDGQMVQFTTTDAQGEFEFRRLDPGRKYSVRVDGEENVPDNANFIWLIRQQEYSCPFQNWPMENFNSRPLHPIPAGGIGVDG